MSDPTHDHQDVTHDATETAGIDNGRRKLAGTALGVAAVFTLSSRPVWANQCTISGMMSGNLSAPKGQTCDGCTPGYWKQSQHLDSWAPTGFKTTDKFNTVFGVTQYNKSNGQPYTLLEVLKTLNGSGDPISTNLGFHAVAALLNAGHPNVNFGYTAGELITLFRNNYLSNPEKLKNSLAMLNERGCPLN
ncbi:MAG: hypothetical protein ABS91_01570 [Thiobacillus sp. SCN 64-35]|nr:MAG: hypothetical protein ABS91_01570 [Thiobacillus sp. SCN 64-35]